MYLKCILLILFCLAVTKPVVAKIRNGYWADMASAQECLRQLNERLLVNPDMPVSEKRRIRAAIDRHWQVVSRYRLTDALLAQFRLVSPDMFAQMDQLLDKRGRETDIHVRFIPEEHATVSLSGASFFWPSRCDEDASRSSFGEFTVAIDVWICDTALNLLAHEFGHIKHIVPNVAAYRRYYANTYSRSMTVARRGHNASDPSGRMAYTFGSQYLRDRRAFTLAAGKRPQRVTAILKNVRTGLRHVGEATMNESIASSNSFK